MIRQCLCWACWDKHSERGCGLAVRVESAAPADGLLEPCSPWGGAIRGVEEGCEGSASCGAGISPLPTACPSMVTQGSWEGPGTQAGHRLHTHMTRVRAERATHFPLERWQMPRSSPGRTRNTQAMSGVGEEEDRQTDTRTDSCLEEAAF